MLNKWYATLISAEMDMDPFHYFKENEISDNDTLRMTAASGYQLLQTIGIMGLLITLIVCFIQMMFAKRGGKLEEVKRRLLWEVMIGICIFAFLFIAGTILSISKKIV